jgi:SAM-dependent methyltransferase
LPSSRLLEIGERGDRAVADLRRGAGWIDRQLHHDGPELLDLDTTPRDVKRRILDDVERISRISLLYPYWVRRVGRMIVEARRTRRGRPVRVLDVGAGHGGLLFKIGDWARRRRIPVELFGLDVGAEAVESATRAALEEGRKAAFRQGDARDVPFEAGAMDVVLTTFMLHHLPPGDVARVLAEVDRVAAVNFFAFDVRRSLPVVPLLWGILALGAFEAPSRHDAMVSLRRGYSLPEVHALCQAAGMGNVEINAVPPAYWTVTRA